MSRERSCDKALHRRRPRIDRGARLRPRWRTARTRSRLNPSSARARECSRRASRAPRRCPETARSRDRLQVIAPITLGKDIHFRRRRCLVSIQVPRKSRAVDDGDAAARSRATQKRRQRNRRQALADAARERRLAAEKERNVGAQRDADPHQTPARGIRGSHSRLSASSTVAASELPPPMPPPSGMRLVTRDVDAERAARRASCSAVAGANREVASAAQRRELVADATIAPSARCVERDRVAEVERHEQRLEQVIAVGAPTRHVQEQIELRRAREPSACASGIVAARPLHAAASRVAPCDRSTMRISRS